MKNKTIILSVLALLLTGFLTLSLPSGEAVAETKTTALPDRVLGDTNAPVTITEYASFTCAHCSAADIKVIPVIKERYIKTGKVKLIYRDYPMDSISLKAAALSRCMPKGRYYPFVEIIHKNFKTWIRTPQPIETLTQYAQMAGLDADKAKACINDTEMMDALIAMRSEGSKKYNINSTPTFIFNDGEDKLEGNQPVENFIAKIDKLLAKHKKQ